MLFSQNSSISFHGVHFLRLEIQLGCLYRLNLFELSVASSIGTIPMPPELSDEVLLNVVRSYSSHYPSLQWAEEFASVSPQWKHVIDTNKHLLPRLLVDTVKVRGCQIDIRLQANDPQPATDGLPQPLTISNHQVANTAATLRRIAARTLIISLGKVSVKQ